jgi:hypothetical protein
VSDARGRPGSPRSPPSHRRASAIAVGSLLCIASPGVFAAEGCALPTDGHRIDNAARTRALTYRFEPARLATDRHFSLIIATCPATEGAALRVDATMPEHRHGMNYRPGITTLGPGRWRADSLLFHMPGRWELHFDVRENERTERLTDIVEVE